MIEAQQSKARLGFMLALKRSRLGLTGSHLMRPAPAWILGHLQGARIALICSAALVLAAAHSSLLAAVRLDFEGIGDGATAGGFYAGGTDSSGNSGANFGVTFDYGVGLLTSTNGGNAVANPPSGQTVLGVPSLGSFVLLNSSAGFSGGVFFYYSASNSPSTLHVYDGIDGTGALLASFVPTLNAPTGGCGAIYCSWSEATIAFSGIAHSITLTGIRSNLALDDLTLGALGPVSPVPEPAEWLMMIGGLGLMAAYAQARRRQCAPGDSAPRCKH